MLNGRKNKIKQDKHKELRLSIYLYRGFNFQNKLIMVKVVQL